MALSSELSKFKAPGVKMLTKVIDNPPSVTPPSGARILVINSRKGIVNNPVLVSDYQTEYLSMFDGQSEADFRKGNFGALAAEEMLQVAPIWVLNLRNFDDEIDRVGKLKLQFDSNPDNSDNGLSETVPYSNLYDKKQFWRVDPNRLIPNDSEHESLLKLGNIGSKDLSVFVRKTQSQQRDITFDRWYSNLDREMPPYVNPKDRISDWMVDVVVFDNTFNENVNSNPDYGYCFDENGFIKKTVFSEAEGGYVDGMQELQSIQSSGYITTITGSLVTNFTDERGSDLNIVNLINQSVQQLGLVAKLDDQIFDNASLWESENTNVSDGNKKPVPVDLVGHQIFHTDENSHIDEETFYIDEMLKVMSLDNVSYKKNYKLGSFGFNNKVLDTNRMPNTEELVNKHKAYLVGEKTVDGEMIKPQTLDKMVVVGDLDIDISDKWAGSDGNLASITDINYVGETRKVWGFGTIDLPIIPFGSDWSNGDGATDFEYNESGNVFPKDQSNSYFVYPTEHPLSGAPLAFDSESGLVVHNPSEASLENYVWQKDRAGNNISIKTDDFYSGYDSGTEQLVEFSDISSDNYTEQDLNDFIEQNGVDENVYVLSFDKPLGFSVETGNNVNTEIPYVVEDNSISLNDGSSFDVYENNITAYKVENFDDFVDSYKPFTVQSYKARGEQFLNGTESRQEEILDVLTQPTMLNSLANRKLIQWNYIVDGFKSYIGTNVKHQLKKAAEKRVTARAICNMPSVNDFSNSTNPYFSDQVGGNFDAKYIAKGGNRKLPHTNILSLPSTKGWYAYFYGPNLNMESGRTFPPAATVSNSFALKYQNSTPYIIVAGEDNGLLLSMKATGLEYMFSESNEGNGELDSIYPFGYNALTMTEIGGNIQIFGNHTAYNTVSSPMSAIHTSEVVMYIQEQINSLLKRYVFKYNTANNRLRIKEQADVICQAAQDGGAISGFANQMDTNNNTEEVRNNRIGILDTRLFDQNGMEIVLHRTTIDGENNSASFQINQNN